MTTKQPDWEAIERAYRAGMLSVRSIAESHNLTEGAVRKRAKKEGWARDLSDQVKAAAREKLVRAVRIEGTHEDKVRTDAEIVDEASDAAASVVLAHRVGLAQWRTIANKLSTFLGSAEVTADNHGDFARSLNAGVDAQLKVIKGERQAYNLDTETGDKTVSDLAALMDDLTKDA